MLHRLVIVGVLLGSAAAIAQPAARAVDPVFEKQSRAELAAVSADAAAAYDEGNAARDAMRIDDAIRAYEKTVELAPKVDHGHRRLCGALLAREVARAVAECELALSLSPESPFNKGALATALIVRKQAGDLERAVVLARQAADARPSDAWALIAWCQAAFQLHNFIDLPKCSERLLQVDPNGLQANIYGSVAASLVRDFDEARRLLRKAKEAGLPQPVYDSMSSAVDKLEHEQASPFPISADEALEIGAAVLGIWLLVFLVLIAVAGGLSHATLRTIDPTAKDAAGSARERRLRKSYRVVLALAGIFFYLSLPIMIVAAVVAGGIVILVFDEMGGIPIVLLWLIGAGVVATIGAILRSFFVRGEHKPLGTPVSFAAYPKLKELLDEVAAAIGTRPVDKAYLAPGTSIGVTERGSVWRSLRGSKRTERSVVLGVALFDAMKQVQLRAILAHEYGHFQNNDTAGGGFALAVRRSLMALAVRLKKSGVASMLNPVWWFVRIFYRAYLGMSQGASRLQEVLADRWAIGAYGTSAFASAQRHVATRTVEFRHDLEAILKETIANSWSLPNLYEVVPESKLSDAELTSAVNKSIDRAPTLYDSHPSTRQRIEWAEQLAVARELRPDDEQPVWELFSDPENIERAMTAIIRDEMLHKRGIIISGADDAAPDSDDESADPAAGASA